MRVDELDESRLKLEPSNFSVTLDLQLSCKYNQLSCKFHMVDVMQDMGENPLSSIEIIAFRQKLNLSRSELARKLGLTPQAVEKWERDTGMRIPGGWRYALFNIANGMTPTYGASRLLEMLREGQDWPYEFRYQPETSWSNWLEQVSEINSLAEKHGMLFWQEGHPQQFPTTLCRFDFLDDATRMQTVETRN